MHPVLPPFAPSKPLIPGANAIPWTFSKPPPSAGQFSHGSIQLGVPYFYAGGVGVLGHGYGLLLVKHVRKGLRDAEYENLVREIGADKYRRLMEAETARAASVQENAEDIATFLGNHPDYVDSVQNGNVMQIAL
jgi:hypothetical protein